MTALSHTTAPQFTCAAFISYRWFSADREAAKWLQDALEGYYLPKDLKGVPPLAAKTRRLGKMRSPPPSG
jgi:hypothetical protein